MASTSAISSSRKAWLNFSFSWAILDYFRVQLRFSLKSGQLIFAFLLYFERNKIQISEILISEKNARRLWPVSPDGWGSKSPPRLLKIPTYPHHFFLQKSPHFWGKIPTSVSHNIEKWPPCLFYCIFMWQFFEKCDVFGEIFFFKLKFFSKKRKEIKSNFNFNFMYY